MRIKTIRDSSVEEINRSADAFINACGYEARACSLARRLVPRVNHRTSIAFKEWNADLSRPENETYLRNAGFELVESGGGESRTCADVLSGLIQQSEIRSIAIDISSMTRSWHGGLVRALRSTNRESELDTYFAYTPAMFSPPPKHGSINEVVAPVEGFASLVTPDLPIALIVGLGYEKDRAIGLQQLLDPKRTLVMTPRFRKRVDLFHSAVLKANRELLDAMPQALQFDYWIDEPSATFGQLASIVSGLVSNYRVVLASLGPKMFGLVCFLLATRLPQLSVWRVSSGIHGKPRQSRPDEKHPVVLKVTWLPEAP